MRLFDLIDAVNDVCFWDGKLAASDRVRIAKQIASTQGKPGAYAATFALDATERKKGIRLFTGEITQSAAARHIAGEEACRALLLLDVNDKPVKDVLTSASQSLLDVLRRSEREHKDSTMGGNPGTFCCCRCSVSVWRHITAGGLDRAEDRLAGGLRKLKQYRSDGRWGAFPFWYTLSALVEMDIPQVKSEIKSVASLLERAAKRTSSANVYEERRSEVARRCLQKI
jgi:hypothetical protein